jgi:hypothetical protein
MMTAVHMTFAFFTLQDQSDGSRFMDGHRGNVSPQPGV